MNDIQEILDEADARIETKKARGTGGNGNGHGLKVHCEPAAAAFAGPPWPKAIGEAAYYGLAGDIVALFRGQTEADPGGILLQLLAAVGNWCGRTAHFTVDGATHYLNLFAVIVGETSKARKGTSWERVWQVMHAADPDWAIKRIQSGLVTGEGLVYQIRDKVVKWEPTRDKGITTGSKEVEVDPGEEDKRLLCIEGEFAGVLKAMDRQGNNLSARLRDAWAGKPLGSMTKNTQTRCREPHVSVVGHITVEEVKRYLTATEMGNGFGNRFLWICVERQGCLPFGGNDVEIPIQTLDALREVRSYAGDVGRLNWASETRPLWAKSYRRLSEGRPGLAGSMVARAEAQVTRLACLYAVLDKAWSVTPEHLAAALEIWRACEESIAFIFGQSIGDPVADEMLRELQARPEGMTRTAIRDFLGRHESTGRIAAALTSLHRLKLATVTYEASGRGRPQETWHASANSGPAGNGNGQ